MRGLYLAAALSLIATQACAAGVKMHCYRGYGVSNCRIETIEPAAPLTPAEIEAAAAEDRKWVAFCQPQKNVDAYGVNRLTYAHKGCEFGRSE